MSGKNMDRGNEKSKMIISQINFCRLKMWSFVSWNGLLFCCFCSVIPNSCDHQSPLFMGFLRQEYWSGLPLPSPVDPPKPRIEPASPALAGGFFTTGPPGNLVEMVKQSCLTFCNPVDSSSSGSSVHGLLQTRTLEWVAISSFRGSSWPKDRTCISCIGRWVLYCWVTWEASLSKAAVLKRGQFCPPGIFGKVWRCFQLF